MSQNINKLRGVRESRADIVSRIMVHIWATSHAESIIFVRWNYKNHSMIHIRTKFNAVTKE